MEIKIDFSDNLTTQIYKTVYTDSELIPRLGDAVVLGENVLPSDWICGVGYVAEVAWNYAYDELVKSLNNVKMKPSVTVFLEQNNLFKKKD